MYIPFDIDMFEINHTLPSLVSLHIIRQYHIIEIVVLLYSMIIFLFAIWSIDKLSHLLGWMNILKIHVLGDEYHLWTNTEINLRYEWHVFAIHNKWEIYS